MIILSSFYRIFMLILFFNTSNCNNYEGLIVGNKSISECLNGGRKQYSDIEMTTSEKIRKEGYVPEEHVILTQDGFLLTLHRIVGRPGAPTVFLQHGLLTSSYCWVISGKNKSLGFLLADQGYDVWLGNARGSLYSRCHLSSNASKNSIWDFSLHEQGIYDLPAMIRYITKIKNDNLTYIGHSMGTTLFYIMAAERPDIASKIKGMASLAPVAFLYNMKSILRFLAPFTYTLQKILDFLLGGEFFVQIDLWKTFTKYFCDMFSVERKICVFVIFFLTGGYDPGQFNYTLTPEILNHFPTGSSVKTVVHYSQFVKVEKFRQYDYGTKRNLEIYNNTEPPNYDLSKIQVPISLFWGGNDYFATEKDVDHLYNLIPKKVLKYKVKYANFNHFDFTFGIDARELVYEKVISTIERYR